jgi:hypothetical protein
MFIGIGQKSTVQKKTPQNYMKIPDIQAREMKKVFFAVAK